MKWVWIVMEKAGLLDDIQISGLRNGSGRENDIIQSFMKLILTHTH